MHGFLRLSLVSVVLLMLVGCKNTPTQVLCSAECELAKLAPYKISQVDKVEITPGGGGLFSRITQGSADAYTLTARSTLAYDIRQLNSVMQCAAIKFAEAHGYAGVKSDKLSHTSFVEKNLAKASLIVFMHNAPLPGDVSSLEKLSHHCEQMPAEARIGALPSKMNYHNTPTSQPFGNYPQMR